LPFDGYKVFRGDLDFARLRLGEASITYGEGLSTPIAGISLSGDYTFIQELRIVARLIPRRRHHYYDLEMAEGIDPVPIVATCVGLDQMDRVVFTGGGF
jgi:hypothetical protein